MGMQRCVLGGKVQVTGLGDCEQCSLPRRPSRDDECVCDLAPNVTNSVARSLVIQHTWQGTLRPVEAGRVGGAHRGVAIIADVSLAIMQEIHAARMCRATLPVICEGGALRVIIAKLFARLPASRYVLPLTICTIATATAIKFKFVSNRPGNLAKGSFPMAFVGPEIFTLHIRAINARDGVIRHLKARSAQC